MAMDTEISAPQLTSMLTESGCLEKGEVSNVVSQTDRIGDGFTSVFFDLKITCTNGGTGTKPANCMAKIAKPDFLDVGIAEASFYKLAARKEPFPALLTMDGALIDRANAKVAILLESCGEAVLEHVWAA